MENEFNKNVEQLLDNCNKIEELTINAFSLSKQIAIDFLKNRKDKTFYFTDYYEYCCDDVCITYDGENHPEYKANPFSVVYSVWLDDNDNIIIETEDGNMTDTSMSSFAMDFVYLVVSMVRYSEIELED